MFIPKGFEASIREGVMGDLLEVVSMEAEVWLRKSWEDEMVLVGMVEEGEWRGGRESNRFGNESRMEDVCVWGCCVGWVCVGVVVLGSEVE